MPARMGPKKVNKYSNELERTAVRLSNAPGLKVKDVSAGAFGEPARPRI